MWIRKFIACAVLLTIGSVSSPITFAIDVDPDRPKPKLKFGPAFRRQLQQPVSASWSNSNEQATQFTLRHIVGRLSSGWEVAILLDRRIDPDQEMPAISLVNEPLIDGIRTVAKHANADVSVVGNVVYIGPTFAVAKLRTLIHRRIQELQNTSVPRRRQLELTKRRDLHWGDLSQPRELLADVTGRYRIQTTGDDRVKHDLWASSTLPSLNPTETISLLLIQFDATFSWQERATGIEIKAAPRTATIERSYRLRSGCASDVAKKWETELPGITTSISRASIKVVGTIEQHESIDALLKPNSNTAPPKATGSLARQRFTLKVDGAKASAIIRQLQQSGIKIELDEKKLTAAGIDLDKAVSINVKQDVAAELFRQLLEPLGLEFQIRGNAVEVKLP